MAILMLIIGFVIGMGIVLLRDAHLTRHRAHLGKHKEEPHKHSTNY